VGWPDAALLVIALAIAVLAMGSAIWAGTFHPVWA